MATPTKYYESKTKFENGNVYCSGDLYGTEEDFWADCSEGKIVFIEDIQVAIENNIDLYEK